MLACVTRNVRVAILISQWLSPGVAGSSLTMGGPAADQAGNVMNRVMNNADAVLITNE